MGKRCKKCRLHKVVEFELCHECWRRACAALLRRRKLRNRKRNRGRPK